MAEPMLDNPGPQAPLALPEGDPLPGLYRHYKGGLYRVLGLARHSESLEVMVLYQALYGTQGLWVRPRAMFLESVQHGNTACPRFAWAGDASPSSGPARDASQGVSAPQGDID